MCAKITDTNPKVIKQVALFRLNQWFSEVGVSKWRQHSKFEAR